VVEKDRVEPWEGKGHVVTEENQAHMESGELWDHQVKGGNRESKEFRVPEEFPVQKENPENPFQLPP